MDRNRGRTPALRVTALLPFAVAAACYAAYLSTPETLPSPAGVAAQGNGQGNGPANGQSNDTCVVPSNATGNCLSTFGVAVAPIGAIYPGQAKQLRVTWSNPNAFDILVSSYAAAVNVPAAVSARCPAATLQVPAGTRTLDPKVAVPGKGTASTDIAVALPATAPNGCQGVSFRVTVTATAVKK